MDEKFRSVHLNFKIRVKARINKSQVGRPKCIFKHGVGFELALGRCEFIVIDNYLARLLDRAHHGHFFAPLEKANVTESDVKQTTEFVAVAGITSTVIKLKLALAVLFDSELTSTNNIVSE